MRGDLPAELVLMARMLGLTMLMRGPLPRGVPYLPILEALGPPDHYRNALWAALGVGCALVLATGWTRLGSGLMGAALMLGLLGTRGGHSVADTYAACLLLMLALSNQATGTALLRWQVALLYAAAGMHKALDPDWWDGRTMHTLLVDRHGHGWFSPLHQSLGLGSLLGAVTIGVQFLLAGCFLYRDLYRAGVVLALGFHTGMVLLLGTTFGPFFVALVASYQAFMPPPRHAWPLLAWAALLPLAPAEVRPWCVVPIAVHEALRALGSRPPPPR